MAGEKVIARYTLCIIDCDAPLVPVTITLAGVLSSDWASFFAAV
jgi:hypothetical protein